MLEDDATAGQTFELYGPKNYSMAEIAQLADREIFKHRRHVNIPKRIMKPIAKLLNQVIWWKTTSADEVEREFIDQVIDPKAKTFKDLDIEPGDLADYTFEYLVSPRFSPPPCCLMYYITVIVYSSEADGSNLSYSKISGARLTTTCHLQQSGKRGRKRSICMSLIINRTRIKCFHLDQSSVVHIILPTV